MTTITTSPRSILETVVGKGKPVAYALDGYPVLGLTEADGFAPKISMKCHGHDHDGLGYHYHAAEMYPFVLGGFQRRGRRGRWAGSIPARAQGVREALQALRGAEITGFEKTGENAYQLSYSVDGDPRHGAVTHREDGTFSLREFDNGREGKTSEVIASVEAAGRGWRSSPRRSG